MQTAACKVTSLYLGYNQITDAGVTTLCRTLKGAQCPVQVLNLSGNSAACKVTELDLSGNQVTDAGVASLCQALQTPACKVTNLYLSHNQVTDAGVTTLCRTLKGAQCPVQVLSLSGNSQFTIDGKRRLKKLLKRQPRLNLFEF